ncbi:MAG TPA: phospholipase C, phosphocholine-specific [Mycobacteriales bacterium]|nr:phospholipase C, phosphocholine-specific [Mycobacteriales bacterium]
MAELSRRRFLATGAVAAGVLVVGSRPAAAATDSGARDESTPVYGDIRDVKHVVVLMQENRSYDHYFGTLSGGRGFADRSTILLPGGYSVFQQPTAAPGEVATGAQYPWALSSAPTSSYPPDNQPPTSAVGAQNTGDLPHGWDDQHEAWQGGVMNGWITSKEGPLTMGFLTRADIPYHYALADAYTIGDAYHSSVFSSTVPNRTYLWSGTIDAARQRGDVVVSSNGSDLSWETYAETLEAAGVSWRVYQCVDNFDNGLEYFKNFAVYDPAQSGTPAPGNPLYDNGVAKVAESITGPTANADNLVAAIRADVVGGTLPQVSWVITNQQFSEHPAGSPGNGAYLINGILEALNADPAVLDSTVFIINYDENDGWFDHVPPPVAPHGTADEWCHGGSAGLGALPVGLGFRVPLILVSPWTRGGWVTSEVSDHTSILQFLEQWTTAIGTPAMCPNISEWRRSVCGDLTRAFDFAHPVFGLPDLPTPTVTADSSSGPYEPSPATNGMPPQELGNRPARPLPYQPNANLTSVAIRDDGSFRAHLSFSNSGPVAAKSCHFAVYNNLANPTLTEYPANAPSQHTIGPEKSNLGAVTKAAFNLGDPPGVGAYDITVVGPNRFLRRFAGDIFAGDSTSRVTVDYPYGAGHQPRLRVLLANTDFVGVTFVVREQHYSTGVTKIRVPARSTRSLLLNPLRTGGGWYDVVVTVARDPSWSRRYVGHLETGRPSTTGS